MKTKQMLITPITPEGQVSANPILVRRGILIQLRELLWEYTRDFLALYGLLSLLWWIL